MPCVPLLVPRPTVTGVRAEADEILAVGRWLRREARAGAVRVLGPVDAAQAAALASVLEGVEDREQNPPA